MQTIFIMICACAAALGIAALFGIMTHPKRKAERQALASRAIAVALLAGFDTSALASAISELAPCLADADASRISACLRSLDAQHHALREECEMIDMLLGTAGRDSAAYEKRLDEYDALRSRLHLLANVRRALESDILLIRRTAMLDTRPAPSAPRELPDTG